MSNFEDCEAVRLSFLVMFSKVCSDEEWLQPGNKILHTTRFTDIGVTLRWGTELVTSLNMLESLICGDSLNFLVEALCFYTNRNFVIVFTEQRKSRPQPNVAYL